MQMPGHVFVTRGDVTQLACDAWLMPCDVRFQARRFLPPHRQDFTEWPDDNQVLSGSGHGKQRVFELTRWPAGEPRPWLVNVGGFKGKPPEWYAEGVRQALEAILPTVRSAKDHLFGRNRALVATPVVGVGGGNLEDIGRAVQDILNTLYDEASKTDIDFVLVTLGEEPYAAAQLKRGRSPDRWPSLTPQQRDQADRLAQLAGSGRLALFLGAGVSQNAGLPGWNDLLRQIAGAASVPLKDLEELKNPLDQASYLARRLTPVSGATSAGNGEERLREMVRDSLVRGRNHYSLMHSLLAVLPATQAVTTNFDRLFEVAWDAAAAQNREQLRSAWPGGPGPGARPLPVVTSVIPHKIRPNADRWLLKMHGCVSQPESIVLTRENYIRYDYQWAALEGILQATLVTQHMLFVGFSLSDDNFLRILDGVRRVVRPTPALSGDLGPFGTALTTDPPSARQHLFEGDLEWVSTSAAAGGAGPLDVPAAARQLEVFLDYLASRLRTTAYLLNDRYDSLLTAEERQLRDGLRSLFRVVETLRGQGSPVAAEVERLLSRLGKAAM
jgi:hypothetical protein